MAFNITDLKEALSKGSKRLMTLHPDLNHFQVSQLLTVEYYKRTKQPLLNYKDAIHLLIGKGYNVACYNGSAHVTSALCLIKD